MRFTNRKSELAQINQLLKCKQTLKSICFEIYGKSGVGKTELIKKAVDDSVSSDSFFVYFDATADEHQASSFFNTLIESVYMPISHRYNTITNIPVTFSLSKLVNKIVRKNKMFENVLKALTVSTSVIPYIGSPISEMVGEFAIDQSYLKENFLFTYFRQIIKKTRINLIVDNYQFLPDTIKKAFESGINEFETGFTLITINRIKEENNKREVFCDTFEYNSMYLDYFSYDLFVNLMENQNINIMPEETKKIWKITQGNLKDIEIILNEIKINPGYDIIENEIAIKNLDSIQRSILLIASLFPAGMKEGYVIRFVHNIIKETRENNIKMAISNLVQLGYIYINSNTNDMIKPAHETVVNHVKKAIDVFDFTDFCSLLSDSIEDAALNSHGTKDYVYLLHCWVGINSANVLRQKTSLVQELIDIKYKENEYYYIDSVASSLTEVISYLSPRSINKILISFQRVSDFQAGLNLLNNLRINEKNLYEQFNIFYVKFLIQTYLFDDALEELQELPDSSEKLLCQTNALQHLGKDTEVRTLLKDKLGLCPKDENYYIILRNTAHFFKYNEAQENLLSAFAFFSKTQFPKFVLATIKNNLSVIYLWEQYYSKAEECIEYAIQALEEIRSNEVFEPYCNKSILSLMKKEYSEATKYAEKALRNCPRLLTLDLIMLNVNLLIIRLVSGKSTVKETYDALVRIKTEYNIIEDPWYEFQLLYNLNSVAKILDISCPLLPDKCSCFEKDYNDSLTKYYLLVEEKIINNKIKVCLGLSPNWRY